MPVDAMYDMILAIELDINHNGDGVLNDDVTDTTKAYSNKTLHKNML